MANLCKECLGATKKSPPSADDGLSSPASAGSKRLKSLGQGDPVRGRPGRDQGRIERTSAIRVAVRRSDRRDRGQALELHAAAEQRVEVQVEQVLYGSSEEHVVEARVDATARIEYEERRSVVLVVVAFVVHADAQQPLVGRCILHLGVALGVGNRRLTGTRANELVAVEEHLRRGRTAATAGTPGEAGIAGEPAGKNEAGMSR